jgi:hypothetical protein
MSDAEDLVIGAFESIETPRGTAIRLTPASPAWAVVRPVSVACNNDGPLFRFATTIGS